MDPFYLQLELKWAPYITVTFKEAVMGAIRRIIRSGSESEVSEASYKVTVAI